MENTKIKAMVEKLDKEEEALNVTVEKIKLEIAEIQEARARLTGGPVINLDKSEDNFKGGNGVPNSLEDVGKNLTGLGVKKSE